MWRMMMRRRRMKMAAFPQHYCLVKTRGKMIITIMRKMKMILMRIRGTKIIMTMKMRILYKTLKTCRHCKNDF
jgi:hypothetical protein